jgi:uncharacterized membrane protein YgaE (UPF0421/DUF939 family)
LEVIVLRIPKLGMRTIKTGIAVFFCMLLGKFVAENLFFSAVACIISVQDTVKGSLKSGFNRVAGTILGGIIGFLFALIKPGDPFLCSIGIIITIYICNLLKANTIVVGCVTFLAIHLGVGTSDPVYYSIHRVLDTSVGVVFGVVVNYVLARPNYFDNTLDKFKMIENMTLEWVKNRIVDKEEKDASEIKEVIQILESIYSKYLDEVDYSLSQANVDILEKTINTCREIYFHMQSICLLEDKLYLKEETYNCLKDTFGVEKLDWTIDEEKSPVFNYHLMKILCEIEFLNKLNTSITLEEDL